MSTNFYDANADAFADRTRDLDMSEAYAPFLGRLPASARILDAGCGSGRDARAFAQAGHDVVALDASAGMADRASQLLGRPVLHMLFQDRPFEREFDGIWAAASLLHVPLAQAPEVFARFVRALRPRGIWYMSFKTGAGEHHRGGRLFVDHTEASLRALLDPLEDLEVIEVWSSEDVRVGESRPPWVNCIARRKG